VPRVRTLARLAEPGRGRDERAVRSVGRTDGRVAGREHLFAVDDLGSLIVTVTRSP
jgi:hypothetical protein